MRHLFVSAVSLAALCTGGTAAAQAAPAQAGTAQAGTAQEAPPVGEDIVVTGEKAARSLQDTVTSVAVTTPRRIEQENIVTLQDVYQRTANVTETYGSSGYTIRGIANRGVSAGGDGALSTVYLDGAALPATLLQAAPTDMWDVAQVEILRGPQSTLQGLNALSGAVIVNTVDPGMTWDVRARVMVASGNETQAAAALGGPIIPGELAFRLSAEKRDSDGFTENIIRHRPENPLDSINLRGKLLWTPSALPGFEARAGFTHYHRYGGYPFSYSNIDQPGFYDHRIATSNDPNDSRADTDIATLDLRYAIGHGLTLSSVSAYNHVNDHSRYDNDLSPASGSVFQQKSRFRTLSQEVRLNFDGPRLSGLIGGFYYDRDQVADATSQVGVPTPGGLIGTMLQGSGFDAATAAQIAGLYVQALPVIPVSYASHTPTHVQTYAAFGDGRFRLTDRLTVLGGFRYDHERNSFQVDQVTTFAGTYPNPASYGALAPVIVSLNAAVAGMVAQANGTAPRSTRSFDAFLPKLGLEMAWTPDITTAFTVQRGYRSGGSSTNTARSRTFAYDPEYTWNYELSFRSAWFDGALTLNANAFYIDWKNQQTSVNFGLNNYDTNTVNAGRSHLYGFEVEATHRVSHAFDWYASVGHVRTRFDDFTVSTGSFTDLTGLEFAYAPRWTIAGGFNLRPVERLSINVNANHRSAVFSQTTVPQSDWRLAGRTLVNLRVAYRVGPMEVSGFVNNALNEQYLQYADVEAGRGVLGNPRVFGVAAGFRW